MFDTANCRALDLFPIDAIIKRLVNQPHHANIITPYDVETEWHDGRSFVVVGCAYDSFDRLS